MKRRQVLKNTAAAMAALAASPVLSGAPMIPPSRKEAFATALRAKPWLSGFAHTDRQRFDATAKISGRWPEGVSGTLYRNGPAAHELGDFRHSHWFDGDGLLHAYRVGADGVSHQARHVETHKRLAERKAGRPLFSSFDSVIADPAPVIGPDSVNPANISVLHHHGELLALWEAGSPYLMNEANLDTRGVYTFSDDTAGAPFSAHPRVEPDGTLWNFGYLSSANLLVLWHIDRNGKLQKMGKIDAAPITMVHDFVVTQRHIVLLIAPFHFTDSDSESFLQAHQWNPQDPTRVLVVDKDDFSSYQWFELPAQWVFHFGNAWEDKAGVIRFDAPRYDDPSVMTVNFRVIMRGNTLPISALRHHSNRIDTRTGHCSEEPCLSANIQSEFPCVDPRVSCRQYSKVVMLTYNTQQPAPTRVLLNEVSRFDLTSGKLDSYRYPETQIPEEHLYVPDLSAQPEQGGWVIGSALDWKEQRMILNAFDARSINDGPVATATLPYAMPLGLHGKFVHG